MKKHFLSMLFLMFTTSFITQAGTQFVPKEYSYESVGSSVDKTLYFYFCDLFEYPDDIATSTNLTTLEGLTIETSSGNEYIIKWVANAQYLSKTRMQLLRVGDIKGETTFTVSLTYNGETVSNIIPIKVHGLQTSKITSYIDPESTESTIFDVISQTSFYNTSEPTICSLTIDNASELRNGVAELVLDTEKGYNVIRYTKNGSPTNIVSDEIKYTITLSDGTEQSSNIVKTYITKNCYATKVLEYFPAPGQFRTETWDNPTGGIGEGTDISMSLGGLGGYIVLGFDQPIYNNPQNPYGVDFTIQGNSFIADEKGVWTEPGAVQVMEDLNGDGIPNDGEWYELAGSDYWLSTTKHNVSITYYNPHYNSRYTVPWTMTYNDLNGDIAQKHGAVLSNSFHEHSFYPDFFYNQDNPNASYRWYNPNVNRDSITISGISEIRGCIDMRTPSYIEFYAAAGFGYCDNKGYNQSDLRIAENPYGRPSLGEAASDGMDISWAVDKDGNHVDLEKIDFVKIYTAGNQNAGWLGEWSTEILNCAITLPDPNYEPKDYYYNYVGITQLQVPLGHTCQYEGFLFKNGRPVKDAVQKWWLTDAEGNTSDEINAIAEIDNTGLFTAKGYGTVWVHFSAMDSITEESFEVSVSKLTGVEISLEGNASSTSNEELSCIVGERVFINVESTDDNSGSLNGTTSNRYIYDSYTWQNSNPNVGTISNGTFIAVEPGTTTLTVISNTDNSLKDQITINVLDIPEIKITPIQIAANTPSGELLNSAIFSTENNATVYMDEVSAVKGLANVRLFNNHLYYEFTEGEYVTDILKFKITCYGQVKDVEVPITYGPSNLASSKKLLIAYNNESGINQLAGLDAETYESKTYIENIGDIKADNILVDGSYAYVTNDSNITRYDVEWGKVFASSTLTTSTKHPIAIYKDKILVGDGDILKIFYKTDLESYKSIALNGIINQIVINGDIAYILTTDSDNLAKMNVVNMATWVITESDIAMENVVAPAGMYLNNDKLYVPMGATINSTTSMAVFNPSDNTSYITNSSIEYPMETLNISVRAGNTIMISCADGFVAYDLETETFGTELLMNCGAMPSNAVAETFETTVDGITNSYERYYVVYADAGMLVYESTDFMTPIQQIMIVPSALNIMAATEQNEAPTVKKAYSYTSGMYERATSVKSCTAAKLTTCFTDDGGTSTDNFTMYIREDVDWIDLTYAANGNITPKVKFTGDVDDKTDFVFTLECIDKNGASVKNTATFRITPRIYKPTIKNANISIQTNLETSDTLAVSNIFEYTQSTTNLTFTTVVTNISDANLITSAEVNADGNLVISVPEETKGVAEIELTQTITHKTYGSKEFKTTIPITLEYEDVTTGIDTHSYSDLSTFYNNNTLFIKNANGASAEIYSIFGAKIISFAITDDNFSTQLHLNSGIYIVNCNGKTAKIIVP